MIVRVWDAAFGRVLPNDCGARGGANSQARDLASATNELRDIR